MNSIEKKNPSKKIFSPQKRQFFINYSPPGGFCKIINSMQFHFLAVHSKLKRLDIVPLVCTVEQIRLLRGLGGELIN